MIQLKAILQVPQLAFQHNLLEHSAVALVLEFLLSLPGKAVHQCIWFGSE